MNSSRDTARLWLRPGVASFGSDAVLYRDNLRSRIEAIMSLQHNDIRASAEKQLEAYLEEAVSGGADSIILEYVPDGLDLKLPRGKACR